MTQRKILSTIILILLSMSTSFAQGKAEVYSQEVSKMLQIDRKMVALDVRTTKEFNNGHIKGALNIDIRQSDAFSKIDKLDKNTKYVVYCRTNHRSTTAVNYMLQNKFKIIYQMMDGFSGWDANHLEIEK